MGRADSSLHATGAQIELLENTSSYSFPQPLIVIFISPKVSRLAPEALDRLNRISAVPSLVLIHPRSGNPPPQYSAYAAFLPRVVPVTTPLICTRSYFAIKSYSVNHQTLDMEVLKAQFNLVIVSLADQL